MGWREEEEKARQMKAANDLRQEKLNNFDMGFGSSGGKLPRFIKEASEGLPKLPANKFDSEFIRSVDIVCQNGINAAAIGNLIEQFSKRGTSTDHLRGLTQDAIYKHLGATLKKYRSEIYEPLKAAFEGGGK